MSRMSKTAKDWNGLKLGFLKTVRPNSFSNLIPAVCNFKNNVQGRSEDIFVCLGGSLILSFTCNFFAYFKGLFTWSGGPRSSWVGFFCFHALGDTKQKKPTPLDRGPPLHVNRV